MIKCILTGIMPTNCYILYDNDYKEAMVIDPGYEASEIVNFIKENGLKLKYIYLTHCHFDHIMGAAWLKEQIDAPISCLDKEKENCNDENITMGKVAILKSITVKINKVFFENDEIQIGNLNFKVIHTPGHTSGSSCLYGDGILISGDTLFNGTYGRCDLPTGNIQDIIKSIKTKLFTLPDSTIVYPGHGEATTIGKEIRNEDF